MVWTMLFYFLLKEQAKKAINSGDNTIPTNPVIIKAPEISEDTEPLELAKEFRRRVK